MSALCLQDLEEVRAKLRRGSQILFTRDSGCLQPLLALIRRQRHRALVLWALEGCRPPWRCLPADDRGNSALPRPCRPRAFGPKEAML